MEFHGYCRNLEETARSLGHDVVKHTFFPFTANPLNPTAVTIIRKETDVPPPSHVLACPRFKTPLEQIGNAYFSRDALAVYPIIEGIPCLRIENAILASKYREVVAAGQPDCVWAVT